MQERYAAVHQEHGAVSEALEEMQRQLAAVQHQCTSLEVALREKQADIEAMMQESHGRAEEQQAVETAMAALTLRMGEAEKEKEGLASAMAAKEAERKAVETEKAARQAALDALDTDLAQHRVRLSGVDADVEAKQAELAQVRSWAWLFDCLRGFHTLTRTCPRAYIDKWQDRRTGIRKGRLGAQTQRTINGGSGSGYRGMVHCMA